MRDPKRINKTLNLIRNIWKTYPDLRLTQLIMNALKMDGDPYYIEDKDLCQALEFYREENKFEYN